MLGMLQVTRKSQDFHILVIMIGTTTNEMECQYFGIKIVFLL